MSTSIDPLRPTAQDLHRFWFEVSNTKQWYEIIRECRAWFGNNWRTQRKVKRKLEKPQWNNNTCLEVWFEFPNPQFATWMSVKYSLQVRSDYKKDTGK